MFKQFAQYVPAKEMKKGTNELNLPYKFSLFWLVLIGA
jgi:hypothetical protein